jgi:sulfate adenylyltransferase subunit 2
MTAIHKRNSLSHLALLEAESIHIFREVAAEFERPVLLFSGGKDSIVMLRLAEKAFRPGKFPFPLMHIDTEHNFPEVIEYRDRRAAELGEKLIVRSVEDSIRQGRIVERAGQDNSRNRMQITTLLDAIGEFRFQAVFGGARRDEEKARAKERVFSFRDQHGQWDPKNQRPELWNLYNGRIHLGEHIRVFPISNWTELDVWQYIAEESLEVPSIYYAHRRPTVIRNGLVVPISHLLPPEPQEAVEDRLVRFRTVGDMSCTACVESPAVNATEIIAETAVTRITERGATRVDDRVSEASMEDRKRAGYF